MLKKLFDNDIIPKGNETDIISNQYIKKIREEIVNYFKSLYIKVSVENNNDNYSFIGMKGYHIIDIEFYNGSCNIKKLTSYNVNIITRCFYHCYKLYEKFGIFIDTFNWGFMGSSLQTIGFHMDSDNKTIINNDFVNNYLPKIRFCDEINKTPEIGLHDFIFENKDVESLFITKLKESFNNVKIVDNE